jgi:hypothetical protein
MQIWSGADSTGTLLASYSSTNPIPESRIVLLPSNQINIRYTSSSSSGHFMAKWLCASGELPIELITFCFYTLLWFSHLCFIQQAAVHPSRCFQAIPTLWARQLMLILLVEHIFQMEQFTITGNTVSSIAPIPLWSRQHWNYSNFNFKIRFIKVR